MDNWIAVIGNLSDGFNMYGPFLSEASAEEFAEIENGGCEWWIVKLQPV